MSESSPPGIVEGSAERPGQNVKPDVVSAVLDDFRAWLTALPAAEQEYESAGGEPSLDLHTLLAQLVAVRQEVNLQTRAVRAQQEQNVETLRQLTTALDTLRRSQERGEESQEQILDETVRPLLKTLVDLYDAVSLAGREMQRLRETVLPNLEELASEPKPAPQPEPAPAPSLWARWFGPPTRQVPPRDTGASQERERLARESAERVRQFLSSLVTGYTMSVQRIERSLQQHGLEAISTAGERFDPELMEVVEAVADSGLPSGTVVEEVRRGYLCKGRVFRYAQVSVAKG
jgi:molecular chaperone GrpE